ncbi:alanine racemase [Amycolatopsis sp. lyj-109]|uniref:alanine racemase n=1 Tax=Amycolatopsis sp. lyj-109 TaxID=2789287 RepID=UPI00397E6BB8
MPPSSPRAQVDIDLDAIRHNLTLLGARAPGSQVMAVVKADAYGHGALPVARAAVEAGATWLGTCSLGEALALREAGIETRLFSWLDTPDADFAAGIENDIDLAASSLGELRRIAAAAKPGTPARVHLKIDTGLSRNGCPPSAWAELVEAAAAEPRVEVVAIWSHLACADEPDHPATDLQAKRFAEAYDAACAAGLDPMRHLANSAALLTRPDLHFDVVRPGIAMYGLNPVPQAEDLRPAMTFRSTVALVKRIEAGESVSYGHTWTASRDANLALVPAGYADGVPRSLSGRMDVLLGGQRRPVAGRVCMDQLVVDCGDYEPAVGDDVVLFGAGTRGEPTAREWADKLGTIDYEIVTSMYRPRVRRRYLGDRS